MPVSWMTLRLAAAHLADAIGLTPHQKGWEHRKERDEFAKNNIPPEYHTMWEKWKRVFKGTPDQRAEKFMEYMETDQAQNELHHMQEEDTAKQVAKDLRKRQQEERAEAARAKAQEKADQLAAKCEKICPNCSDSQYEEPEPPGGPKDMVEEALQGVDLLIRKVRDMPDDLQAPRNKHVPRQEIEKGLQQIQEQIEHILDEPPTSGVMRGLQKQLEVLRWYFQQNYPMNKHAIEAIASMSRLIDSVFDMLVEFCKALPRVYQARARALAKRDQWCAKNCDWCGVNPNRAELEDAPFLQVFRG